jgi:lipopolysaccharide/colanic/teichoic acid biosynthesis glycosyltransferase
MKINKHLNQKVAVAYPAFRASSQRFVLKAKDSFNDPIIKRVMDLFFSAVLIVLAFPFSIAIVLAIKIEDGGPVFYRQERWGRRGRKFQALKFRTMVPNSDQVYGIRPAEENDHRITRVGRLLRNMGLDELPQIIHIITGEMSFAGPRSLAVGEIIKDENGKIIRYEDMPIFWERLRVRPGLTSLATIYLPKDSSPYRKFRYDLLYIRKQSSWLDLRLILLSFWISFQGNWETRKSKI